MSTREEQLNCFTTFINETETYICNILQEVGWTVEDTLKEFNKSGHKITEVCDKDDPSYPESYPWQHTITIDNAKLNDILKVQGNKKEVPNKFSDFQVNFTRQEKLLLYEYAIEKTGKLSEPEISIMFNPDEGPKKEMTFAEIVALKRDLKRRRLKHRTTKAPPLSHTEELRNLIELQMQALCQYLQPEESKKSIPEKDVGGTSRNYVTDTFNRKFSHKRSKSRSRSKERKLRIKEKKQHRNASKDRKVSYDKDKRKKQLKHIKKDKKRSRSRD